MADRLHDEVKHTISNQHHTEGLCTGTRSTPKHQPSATQDGGIKSQPWKKWLAKEMEALDSSPVGETNGGASTSARPWTIWKPDPKDPSEKPWLYWHDFKATKKNESSDDSEDSDGPKTEMIGTFSRFQSMGIGLV
ncbi:MAG: hypothetical protein Q9214_002317 [Letrouitia sp. 1 TL-2023]